MTLILEVLHLMCDCDSMQRHVLFLDSFAALMYFFLCLSFCTSFCYMSVVLKEASLFASELFRMYEVFCRARGWRWELLTQSRTDIGGFTAAQANVSGVCLFLCLLVFLACSLHCVWIYLTSSLLYVAGDNVYEYMKFESGVHRVQRVPVNDSKIQVLVPFPLPGVVLCYVRVFVCAE